jgi:excisionase family DNA binding protein
MPIEVLKSSPQPLRSQDCVPVSQKILTPPEAALLLQMDHRTLVRWARTGYVPAHPLGEGRRRLWRFFKDELLDWVESQSNAYAGSARRAA